jgi:hypothetical protein
VLFLNGNPSAVPPADSELPWREGPTIQVLRELSVPRQGLKDFSLFEVLLREACLGDRSDHIKQSEDRWSRVLRAHISKSASTSADLLGTTGGFSGGPAQLGQVLNFRVFSQFMALPTERQFFDPYYPKSVQTSRDVMQESAPCTATNMMDIDDQEPCSTGPEGRVPALRQKIADKSPRKGSPVPKRSRFE